MTDLTPEQAQEIVQQGIEREVVKLVRLMLFKIEQQLLSKQRQNTYGHHPESVVSVTDIKRIFAEYTEQTDDRQRDIG